MNEEDRALIRSLIYALCIQATMQSVVAASLNTRQEPEEIEIKQVARRLYRDALQVGSDPTLWL